MPNSNSFQLSEFVNQLERFTGHFPLCRGLFSRDRVRHSIQPEQPLYPQRLNLSCWGFFVGR